MSSSDDGDNFITEFPDGLLDPDATHSRVTPEAKHVEQYVRLHNHIESLRLNRRPQPMGSLTDQDVPVYQMAALFRAAVPAVADPDPAFIDALRLRIEAAATRSVTVQPVHQAEQKPIIRVRQDRRVITRRTILGSGLAAAAAAVGAVAGAAIQHRVTDSQYPDAGTALVPEGAGEWIAVATVDAIPLGSVQRFVTDSVVGFIRRTDAGFSALSGVCTHMACMLYWNAGERTYDCPCHGGRFSEDGASAPSSPVSYQPLPSIQTRVQNGQVWVYVPRHDGVASSTANS